MRGRLLAAVHGGRRRIRSRRGLLPERRPPNTLRLNYSNMPPAEDRRGDPAHGGRTAGDARPARHRSTAGRGRSCAGRSCAAAARSRRGAVMKVLAIEREVPGVDAARMTPLLREEAAVAWRLMKSNVIREAYFDRERHAAVFVLECEGTAAAGAILGSLPLVRAGCIRFEVMALEAYTGIERLFAPVRRPRRKEAGSDATIPPGGRLHGGAVQGKPRGRAASCPRRATPAWMQLVGARDEPLGDRVPRAAARRLRSSMVHAAGRGGPLRSRDTGERARAFRGGRARAGRDGALPHAQRTAHGDAPGGVDRAGLPVDERASTIEARPASLLDALGVEAQFAAATWTITWCSCVRRRRCAGSARTSARSRLRRARRDRDRALGRSALRLRLALLRAGSRRSMRIR